jgi:hypothetical protein
VVKIKEDIEKLWHSKDIQRMILILDGGQECVFEAFAHLPMRLGSRENVKGRVNASEKHDIKVDANSQSQVVLCTLPSKLLRYQGLNF